MNKNNPEVALPKRSQLALNSQSVSRRSLIEQARTLLQSVDTGHVVGLRDHCGEHLALT